MVKAFMHYIYKQEGKKFGAKRLKGEERVKSE